MPAPDCLDGPVARPAGDTAAGPSPPGPRPASFVLRRIGFTPARRRDPASDPAALGLEPLNGATEEDPRGGCAPPAGAERGQQGRGGRQRELFPASAVNLQWSRVRPAGAGLVNNNNYCYMNACLQVLLHTPPFVEVLLNNPSLVPCTRLFSGAMRKLADSAYGAQQIVRPPKEFYQFLKKISSAFTRGDQEDSHEFLRGLLTRIHEECMTNLQSPYTEQEEETSFVYRIFGGVTRSRIHCPTLNYTSEKLESFLDLSLELEHSRSVEDALRQFTASEKLEGENAFKHKGQYTPAVKRFTVHKLPAVLTINLKRFAFGRGKIRREVKYPTTLDLAPFSSNPDSKESAVYNLYGVIVHDGYLVHMGHYMAYAKAANGVWYQFDDEHVAEVPLNEVLAQQAYMLFYMKGEPHHKKAEAKAKGMPAPHNGLNGRIPVSKKAPPSPCANGIGVALDSPKKLGPLLGPVNRPAAYIKNPRSRNPILEIKAPMAGNGTASPRSLSLQIGSPTRSTDGHVRHQSPRCNGNGLAPAERPPVAMSSPGTPSADKGPAASTTPVVAPPSKGKQQRRSTGRSKPRTSPPLGVRSTPKKKKSSSVPLKWLFSGKLALLRLLTTLSGKSVMAQKTTKFCPILRKCVQPHMPESPQQENGRVAASKEGRKPARLFENEDEGSIPSAGPSSNAASNGGQFMRSGSEAAGSGHSTRALEGGASTSLPAVHTRSCGNQASSQHVSSVAGHTRQGSILNATHRHFQRKASTSTITGQDACVAQTAAHREGSETSLGGLPLAGKVRKPHPEQVCKEQAHWNGKVDGAGRATVKRKRDGSDHLWSTTSPHRAIVGQEAESNGNLKGPSLLAPAKLAVGPSQAEGEGVEGQQRASAVVWRPGSKGLYGVQQTGWDTVEDPDVQMATALSSLSTPARKRPDVYDEEYDRGKVKKVKRQRITGSTNMNVFQTHFEERRNLKGRAIGE